MKVILIIIVSEMKDWINRMQFVVSITTNIWFP